MIFRYALKCSGCPARILLRVSVGIELIQPFFVICDNCKTVISGHQEIWYKPKPGAILVLEDAEQIDAEEEPFNQYVNVHPELPSTPEAADMTAPGGSPWLQLTQILGSENLLNYMERMKQFRGLVDSDGLAFRRLAGFYANGDWKHFNDEGGRIFEINWTELNSEWQCHDTFGRITHMLFAPLLVADWLPRIVEEWNMYLISNTAQNGCLVSLFKNESSRTKRLRRQVLNRIEFIIQNKIPLLCAFSAEFYPAGSNAATSDLRLFRDDFDLLKPHYVDCYELAHKVLTLIVAAVNCIERGNPDTFDNKVCMELAAAGLGNFKRIQNVAAFDSKPNAPKRAFLNTLPVFRDLWEQLLDRKLRNAIGHANAHHDRQSGQIVVDDQPHCTYLEFVLKTLRMTHVLLVLLHVLKMCDITILLSTSSAQTGRDPSEADSKASNPKKVRKYKKRKKK